jgi:2-keto-4-pentenoate hydratase/2-oxohepta-3-ene-1,7-dioic acid hydratase in catechol pathway
MRVGLIEGDSLFDLSGTSSMLDLIRSGMAPERSGQPMSLASVTLHAPIPRPDTNIICLGRNYREHAQEMARAGRDAQEKPTFFSKAVTSVIGPADPIPCDPAVSSELDWEVELAVILGREARRVAREHALDYVYGYMVLNDVSARDLQYGYGGQFFYGKSLDGSCPTGPWIVTADEISDPQNVALRLRVNGETLQDASTERMIFDVADIIERLSHGMTLLPGQIIATGTPPGVGHARNPPRYLQPGDVMESEIDGIGTLRNSVVQTRPD